MAETVLEMARRHVADGERIVAERRSSSSSYPGAGGRRVDGGHETRWYAKRTRCVPGTWPANCQRAKAAAAFRARAIHACDGRRRTMSEGTELGLCPRCRKLEGEFTDSRRAGFRYWVWCKSCGWMTEPSRTEDVALKLWNEAKPAK